MNLAAVEAACSTLEVFYNASELARASDVYTYFRKTYKSNDEYP
jgi:hypothetical protein